MPDGLALAVTVALLTVGSVVLIARRAGGLALSLGPVRSGGNGQGAAASERRRIATAIHDGALQLLVSSLGCLRQAKRLLEEDHPSAQPLIGGITHLEAATDMLRSAIFPLRNEPSATPRLVTQVHDLVRRLSHLAPMSVHLSALPDLAAAPNAEEAVAGIVGEALTNAAMHAQARNAWVEIAIGDASVTVSVRDDGIGFDPDEAERQACVRQTLGLHLIRERARLVGGQVVISSRPTSGTTVEASIPWKHVGGAFRRRAINRAEGNGEGT